LLKNHLETCMMHEMHKGHGHDVIEEVMKVWTKQSSQ
jgi:DNA-binding FrmR family transcriptional regulator